MFILTFGIETRESRTEKRESHSQILINSMTFSVCKISLKVLHHMCGESITSEIHIHSCI